MTSTEILALAQIAPSYVFGSPALQAFHERAKRHTGNFYNIDAWYVVVFPSCNGSRPFRTLNHIQYGATVPEIYDIPEGKFQCSFP
jgi:hypothetical protein